MSVVSDHLVGFYESLSPYQHWASLLLVAFALANFRVDFPATVWVVFIVFFSVMLAGNLIRQRRDSPYA